MHSVVLCGSVQAYWIRCAVVTCVTTGAVSRQCGWCCLQALALAALASRFGWEWVDAAWWIRGGGGEVVTSRYFHRKAVLSTLDRLDMEYTSYNCCGCSPLPVIVRVRIAMDGRLCCCINSHSVHCGPSLCGTTCVHVVSCLSVCCRPDMQHTLVVHCRHWWCNCDCEKAAVAGRGVGVVRAVPSRLLLLWDCSLTCTCPLQGAAACGMLHPLLAVLAVSAHELSCFAAFLLPH